MSDQNLGYNTANQETEKLIFEIMLEISNGKLNPNEIPVEEVKQRIRELLKKGTDINKLKEEIKMLIESPNIEDSNSI